MLAAAPIFLFFSHFLILFIAADGAAYDDLAGVNRDAAVPIYPCREPRQRPDLPLLPGSDGGDGFHGSYKLQSPVLLPLLLPVL